MVAGVSDRMSATFFVCVIAELPVHNPVEIE